MMINQMPPVQPPVLRVPRWQRCRRQRRPTTYEYLEGLLHDAERAKRMLPAKEHRRGGRAATSAAAAAAPAAPSPTPRAARADEMENDDEPLFATPGLNTWSQEARTQSEVDDFMYQNSLLLHIIHFGHILYFGHIVSIFVIFCILDMLCILDIFHIL